MTDDFPPVPAARTLWLVTLADLALLLLGFAVLAQASGRATMAQALHERFASATGDWAMYDLSVG